MCLCTLSKQDFPTPVARHAPSMRSLPAPGVEPTPGFPSRCCVPARWCQEGPPLCTSPWSVSIYSRKSLVLLSSVSQARVGGVRGVLEGIRQGKKADMASVTGLPGRVGDSYSSPLSPTASDVTPSVISTGPSLEGGRGASGLMQEQGLPWNLLNF